MAILAVLCGLVPSASCLHSYFQEPWTLIFDFASFFILESSFGVVPGDVSRFVFPLPLQSSPFHALLRVFSWNCCRGSRPWPTHVSFFSLHFLCFWILFTTCTYRLSMTLGCFSCTSYPTLETQRRNRGYSGGRLVRALRTPCTLLVCTFLTAPSLAVDATQEGVNRDATWEDHSETASNAIRAACARTHEAEGCVNSCRSQLAGEASIVPRRTCRLESLAVRVQCPQSRREVSHGNSCRDNHRRRSVQRPPAVSRSSTEHSTLQRPYHGLQSQDPEDTATIQRHKESCRVDVAGKNARARHDGTSRVQSTSAEQLEVSLGQRGVKIVTLNCLVTHASRLDEKNHGTSRSRERCWQWPQQPRDIGVLDKDKDKGKCKLTGIRRMANTTEAWTARADFE